MTMEESETSKVFLEKCQVLEIVVSNFSSSASKIPTLLLTSPLPPAGRTKRKDHRLRSE